MSICNGLKRDIGVRFLKEKNKGGGGATRPHYVELNQKDERKKVGHALRDMSVARQRLNQQRQSLTLMNDKRKSDNNKEDDHQPKHVVIFGW